ncbi:MAG: hypothetical protein IKV14_03005 [Muribaculaceae bacterium]|nr:hypothetical protein [Muribaculaceae bacterium]
MKIFENYNTATQKYGHEIVKTLSDEGIPPQYLLSACKFLQQGIKATDLKHYFRQWMTYVVKNDKNIDVNKLSFEQFYKTIQEYKRNYGIPNKVYDDGTVSIGKIDSHHDISKFPVKNNWCIKQPGMFKNYINQGFSFYIIDNGDESDYVRYVVMMIGENGEKFFYDLDNSQMTPNSISDFQSHLTDEAISFIQKLNENNEYKTNRKMKQVIRLNESDLHRMIKESVRTVLREDESFDYNGNKDKDDYKLIFSIRAWVRKIENVN